MKSLFLRHNQLLTHQISNERHIPNHSHENVEIIYILKGQMSVYMDQEEYVLEKNDIISINSNGLHSLILKEEQTLYMVFHINYKMLTGLMDEKKILFICNSSIEKTPNYLPLQSYIDSYLRVSYENSYYKDVSLNKLSYQLVEYLVQHFSVSYNQSLSLDHKNKNRKKEIEEYIKSNYYNGLSLKDLADYFYLSPTYVSKYFKEVFGMTFLKYLNKVRLNHAINELSSTNYSVTSIAMNTGFPNVSSFIKGFKDEFGTTPHEYRLREPVTQSEQESVLLDSFTEEIEKLLEDNRLKQMNFDIDQEEYKMDLNLQNKKPFNRYWRKTVNLSEASRLMNYNSEEQITQIKKDLDFEYGRVWGVFSKEMKLVKSGRLDEINFFNIERSFDFLMNVNIKPYIVINAEVDTQFLRLTDHHNEQKTIDDFLSVFQAFISHIANRYGLSQVENWCFEITNGSENEFGQSDDYFYFFSSIKKILSQFSNHFKIGGSGFPINFKNDELRMFLKSWFSQQQKPDFLSFHSNPEASHEFSIDKDIRKLLDGQYIRNQVLIVKSILKEEELLIEEIQIPIWNFTPSHHTILNDSCYKGAYVIKNIIDCYDLVDAMGYWYALDSISPSSNTPQLLYGSPGLLSKQNLKKPSYHAYAFLNIGRGTYFLGRNNNSLVTTDGSDNYFIVCHNCGHLNYKYFMDQKIMDNPKMYDDIFEEEEKKAYSYKISNVKNGIYKIKIQSVNEESGNLQKEWTNMNLGADISNSEIQYLKNITVPRIKIKQIKVENGILDLKTTIGRNEFQSVRISYQY
ncbi:helix-turn-helix domain-containing protein [Alkalihalobacillus sp. NPDC078783]